MRDATNTRILSDTSVPGITPGQAVDEIEHQIHHTATLLSMALRYALNAPSNPTTEDLAVLLAAAEERAKSLSSAVQNAHRSMGRAG